MKGKTISVTMTKTMYDKLLKGRKATADEPGFSGCGTYEKVVEYVDAAFGLLGTVTEVIVQ